MGRLCETESLTDIQEEIIRAVRQFVETRSSGGDRARAQGRVPDR